MKNLLFATLAVAAFTACSKDTTAFDVSPVEETAVTFHVQGDFTLSTSPMTRSLEADGKAMTDIWLFDYKDGTLVQSIHQTSSESDFGEPTLTLPYGQHHIYAVASRGTSAVTDTEAHTIVFGRILDTFWTDHALTVSATTTATATLALDRVVTKLSFATTDPIPTGTARVDITPHTWYYGLDYLTAQPTDPSEDEPHSITIPSDFINTTTTFSIFSFSSATEWTTPVTVESYTSTNAVTATVTIPSAPFKANRITQYTGAMWSIGTGLTLTLNADWSSPYNGTW